MASGWLLAAHIDVLQGYAQVRLVTELDDGLEVVNLFGCYADQIVHDLGLNLHSGILDQFDQFFGVLLFQAIPDGDGLFGYFPAWEWFLAHIKGQGIQPLFHRAADQYVSDLLDLHIAVRLQIELHVLFVQVDLHGRVLKVKTVGDLFLGHIHRVVQDLWIHFADNIEGWHGVKIATSCKRQASSQTFFI